MTRLRQRRARNWGSAEIRVVNLLREVPDIHAIPIRNTAFTVGEDDDLERPA
jgi:hypothetical protein